MNAAQRVAGGLIAVGENNPARAQGGADDSGGADTVTDRAGGLISSAADDWRARRQTEFRCRGRRECSSDFRRFLQSRHQGFVDLQKLQQPI